MTYRTIVYCDDPDCRCLDSHGVVVYYGSDLTAACDPGLVPVGYRVEIEIDD